MGMGSSGIQIVSKIAGQVKKLYTWIRSPTWITAGFAMKFAGPNGANFEYTPEQQKIFQENPELYLRYSKMIESELNQRFKFILKGTPDAEAAKQFAINEMSRKLNGNEQLIEAMVPKDFGIGCRRPTPGNGFLEALIQDNVHCFTKNTQRITEKGFIDADGTEHEVDVIICATGFNTSWIPPFPVQGQNGNTLAKMWKDKPSSYISIAVPNMPNYWMMVGPYGR
jgi:cation diffusion facilitator CzcD-associated flavoprotein CzcO